MLLIPKLFIRDGRCVYPESANLSRLHHDPTEMARMLRVLNVRSILVVDLTRMERGSDIDWPTISTIANSVDIPIQLEAGQIDAKFVAQALESGVHRCIVPVGSGQDAAIACSLIAEFGAHRLSVRLPAQLCLGCRSVDDATITQLVGKLGRSACSRVILTLDEQVSWRASDNLEQKLSAVSSGNTSGRLRITVDGGVLDSADLLALNAIAPRMVDSVAVYEPFYASRFPCQAFWCWGDKESIGLEQFSTATLKF